MSSRAVIARLLSGAALLLACSGPYPAPPQLIDTDGTPVCDPGCGANAHCDDAVNACFCDVGAHGDPYEGCEPHADLCAEAAERVGHNVCTHELTDPETWTRYSLGGWGRADVRRVGKYMVPSRPDARLPTVISDANYYRLHLCLMSHGFEPLFGPITPSEYAQLILPKSTREYYAGFIYEFFPEEGEDPVWAFTIEITQQQAELLDEDTTHYVYRYLSDRFFKPLAYTPLGALQTDQAAQWTNTTFPVVFGGKDDVAYEAYNYGIAYGRVRILDAADVEAGTAAFSFQDLLVLDRAPFQLEGVMAGAVTADRQDVLSHLNVLSSQRGTPNLYVKDAHEHFAPYDGELVRLETRTNQYELQTTTLEEAQAFWDSQRPDVEVTVLPDPDYAELPTLAGLPSSTPQERATALSRIGAKAAGLNTLYALVDGPYQVHGFAVSFHHYLAFMEDNGWAVEIDGAMQTLSYAETITAWLGDDDFGSDVIVRRDRLEALRTHMRDQGVVDPALVALVRDRIVDEFGSATTMVRFRSSSNAEDSLEFNGAGIYDSTNGCAADSFDGDDVDPSACDPGKNERTIERALKKVWASLWKLGAFEERAYYQMDHASVAMAVLVSTRFPDEQSNGVAFTGKPDLIDADESDPYTVNVQLGDTNVVNATPGVIAELDRMTMADTEVEQIHRVRASSLVPEGEYVLSDDRLRELGGLMAQIESVYPVDAEADEPESVLLDMEFKVDAAAELRIKQIRPFLRNAFSPTGPSCEDD